MTNAQMKLPPAWSADATLDLISNGNVPSAFCSETDRNFPDSPAVIENRAKEDAVFAERLEAAKQMGAIVMLAECVTIADDNSIKADQNKIQIDTRMKLAALWNPICNPKTVIEQTTTHKTFTRREQYVEQMVKYVGVTPAEAAARYDLETGATVQ